MLRAIGKLCVLLNVLISGVLAAWAMALYTNNTDWSDNPAKADKAAGLVAQRRAVITELQKAVPLAEQSEKTARWMLLAQEQVRRDNRAWYGQELQHLFTGATEKSEGRMVQMDRRQLPVPDPKNPNRPNMVPARTRSGQPLLALTTYNQQYKDLAEQVKAAQQEYEKLVKQDIEYTDRIVGTADMKGLQQRLVDERVKRDGVIDEERQVEPLWKVSEVDTELLLRRRETLEERIKELEDYLRRKYHADVPGR